MTYMSTSYFNFEKIIYKNCSYVTPLRRHNQKPCSKATSIQKEIKRKPSLKHDNIPVIFSYVFGNV